MRLADFAFAFPAILSAIMLTARLRARAWSTPSSRSASSTSRSSRASRAPRPTRVWAREFVLAARACGKGAWRITHRARAAQHRRGADRAGHHPVRRSRSWPRPRCPTWAWARSRRSRPGAACSARRRRCCSRRRCWRSIPGLAIALAVLGLNLLGDGLRDLLDPAPGAVEMTRRHGSPCSKSRPARHAADRARPGLTPCAASTSRWSAARRWAWSANRAAASRSPRWR